MTITWYEICMLLAVPSIIAFLLKLLYTFVLKKSKKVKNDDTAIRKGIQALLRNQLIVSHDKYIKDGFIDVNEKLNYSNMYTCYHNLGKNGVMDNLYKEVMDLPTVSKNQNEED